MYNLQFLEPSTFTALAAHLILFYFLIRLISLTEKKLLLDLKIVKSTLFVLFTCILILEIGLRLSGVFSTYLEEKAGHYESLYKYRPQKAILNREPNSSTELSSPNEFNYTFTSNSMGYSDTEWTPTQTKDTTSILALGDSFTEGYGAPMDSSWVAQIRNFNLGKPVKWFNAGISAADPFANFYSLKKQLHVLNPDITIQMVSEQDFFQDLPMRGGMNRFTKNGKVKYQVSPTGEWLFAYSHVSRALFKPILGLDEFFLKSQTHETKEKKAYEHALQLLSLYNEWAEERNKQVILIIYHTNSYKYLNSKSVLDEIFLQLKPTKNVSIHSLTPCYKENYNRRGKAFHQLWWEKDGHHNSEGYAVMADCISKILKQHLHNEFLSTDSLQSKSILP